MTRSGAVRLMLVAAGVLAIPLGLAGLRPIKATAEGSDAVLPVPPESASPAPLDSLALLVVNHDPFRLTRSPAAIAYSPAPVEPVYVEPPPPKPQLVLTGIVWGDEPSAIVEGLPGIEGARVLRVGESSGSVRIRRITRQDVTLVGLDTTWVLQVRKPW